MPMQSENVKLALPPPASKEELASERVRALFECKALCSAARSHSDTG